ncbi:MAG: hypothetical protein P8Y24_06950 [Gammaproteobacteria bacterium]
MIELAHHLWVDIVHIANSILAGTWIEIILTLLGITGAMFTVQQIHSRLKNSSLLLSVVTKVALLIATIFWLSLMIAVVLITFVNS